MIRRIFFVVIFLSCGIEAASAGIIASADFGAAASSNTMSTPVQPGNLPVVRSSHDDFGMSAVNVIQAPTSSNAAIIGYEIDLVVLPTLTRSRLRLANASLPRSPYSEGLLKPS